MAIQTTLTAAGTFTMGSWKWRVARRNPKAEDFIEVSMAVVRATIWRERGGSIRMPSDGCHHILLRFHPLSYIPCCLTHLPLRDNSDI